MIAPGQPQPPTYTTPEGDVVPVVNLSLTYDDTEPEVRTALIPLWLVGLVAVGWLANRIGMRI